MNRRNNVFGSYKSIAYHYKIDTDKIEVLKGGLQVTKDEADSQYDSVGVQFRCADSNGQGLTQEVFQLFQNWIMQSTNLVIETPSYLNFEVDDLILINGKRCLIDRIETKTFDSRQLRGNRQRTKSEIKVLFIG